MKLEGETLQLEGALLILLDASDPNKAIGPRQVDNYLNQNLQRESEQQQSSDLAFRFGLLGLVH